MPGSAKFCLGSSMARHVSGSRGLRPREVVELRMWMESWFWMNFESPKHTHTSHTAITFTNFKYFEVDFVPTKPAELGKTSTKTGSSCGAATIVAGQGPWGGFFVGVFFVLFCGLKIHQGSGDWTTWRARKARQVHKRLESRCLRRVRCIASVVKFDVSFRQLPCKIFGPSKIRWDPKLENSPFSLTSLPNQRNKWQCPALSSAQASKAILLRGSHCKICCLHTQPCRPWRLRPWMSILHYPLCWLEVSRFLSCK